MLISSMFSQQGIYALKYKVILCELVPESVENSGDDKSTGESSEAKPSESGAESVWQYNFSNDINVTMLFTEDRLNITGTKRYLYTIIILNYTNNTFDYFNLICSCVQHGSTKKNHHPAIDTEY